MKFFGSKKTQDNELFDWLQIVGIRVASGMTLPQAVEGAPALRSSAAHCQMWRQLYERIFDRGTLSPREAIQSLSERLRLEATLRSLVQRKLSTPQIQCWVISALSIFFLVATRLLRPEASSATLAPALALILIVLGIVWSLAIVRSLKRRLWFFEWVLVLSEAESMMSMGMTFRQSFHDALQPKLPGNWPKALEDFLSRYVEALQLFSESCPEVAAPKGAALQTTEQCRWLFEQNQRGIELLPILRHFKERCRQTLEDDLQKHVEIAQWQLLLPLFVCQMPAFFILLLSPLWQQVSQLAVTGA